MGMGHEEGDRDMAKQDLLVQERGQGGEHFELHTGASS